MTKFNLLLDLSSLTHSASDSGIQATHVACKLSHSLHCTIKLYYTFTHSKITETGVNKYIY